ncbi:TolC family protein [Legionella pneumophila serogroup 1]|uniref:Cation efflux system protein CzcC n=1 Tax=Fluoribacter dumoffii TaxID=463 RepID=A0A377GBB1_9GAMM|nr:MULTISPECIES: TolC family protein [Legionellaceae]KTC92801.1 chemiosmotic efflux system C protein C [Fluoribacter dumoffii NY 23]MDW9174426.1 TolC family protein [Legionella pneumophila]SNV18399.1 Heavy metal RND efflux outer membrane protein, CzcC family [Legionella pneumophila]STO22092.1 Cation efflux system protein CzcC [Fluoribacter dumoffii]HAT4425587.1 TolC family protein [Legionella pneumophila]
MKHYRAWQCSCWIVLLLLCSYSAIAGKTLTLQGITQIALANNKDLKAARYNVAIAKARLIQAGLWPNPSVNLSNNDDRLFNDEGEYSRSAGFSQAFPISGRIAKQKTVARLDVMKAIAEIREAERQLSAKVANAFYAAVITERRLQQLNYLLRINKELVNVIHNRYHAAEISKLDENAARIEYLRIVQEKHLLHSLRISQMATLNQLMGRDANSPLSLKADLNTGQNFPELPALKTLALNNRPDRQSIALSINRAIADRHLAKAERFADWTVGLGVQQDKIVVEEGPPQPADRTLGVTLSVPLPLLNQNQGRILEASRTGTQAMMALRALNLSIETEIASNYAQLKALRMSLRETQSVSLKIGVESVKLARDSYENGQISLLNVLQVQKQQNDLQMTYLTTLEKYLQVYVALCTAIGPGHTQGFCPYLAYQRNGYDDGITTAN